MLGLGFVFGFKFIKVDPSTYLMQLKNGRVIREGVGQSFFYFAPTSSLLAVPTGSQSVPFMFEQTTADYQTVTVQGQVVFRITDPQRIVKMLNFTLVPNGKRYVCDDPESVRNRVERGVEVLTQKAISQRVLQACLNEHDAMTEEVFNGLAQREDILALGVEIQSCSILGIRPLVETARALEADIREQLLKQADDAIYLRRHASVENERAIKETELDTDIAVELKQRMIREAQLETEASVHRKKTELKVEALEADIIYEQRRKALVLLEDETHRLQAQSEAYRIRAIMEAFASVDPKVVQVLASSGMGSSELIALAFGHLAENAERIGQLTMSPDLLQTLASAGKN